MEPNRGQSLERLFQQVRPSDVINIAFVLVLLVVCVSFADRVQAWRLLVSLYIAMLLVAGFLIWPPRETRKPLRAFLGRWYPLAFVVVAFFSLAEMVHHVLPYDIDSELIALDYAVFGVHPTVFLSRFLNPYLVDLLEICYASFFFLPAILAVTLYRKDRMSEFEAFAAVVCLGFYLSFLGNLLFPASGPSQTLEALHATSLEGKWVGGFIRRSIFALEPYRWDCFPSGHVEVTIITLVFCYRFERRLFWGMLPVGTGLILSTMFLRYHYVADVVAGGALAVAVVVMSDAMQRAWRRRLVQERMESAPPTCGQADKGIS
jgi:membrane-associated phospholipid phosphatase